MQQLIIILAVIAVVVFFITNHFKRQRIDKRIFLTSVIFIVSFIQYKSLHTVVIGLALPIVVGILQGSLAKVIVDGQEVFTKGNVIGMAFWLVVILVKGEIHSKYIT